MRAGRALMLALLVGCIGILAALPTSAQAYYQHYDCGVLAPNWLTECRSSGLHSWRWNAATYPGPVDHHVESCEYMWNNRTNQIRGGYPLCGDNTTGYVDYGPTSLADYNARVFEGNEANAHTIVGDALTQ